MEPAKPLNKQKRKERSNSSSSAGDARAPFSSVSLLLNVTEPTRLYNWLQLLYEAAPGSRVSQVELYRAYASEFTVGPFARQDVPRSDPDALKMIVDVFPAAALVKEGEKYLIKGIRPRQILASSSEAQLRAIKRPRLQHTCSRSQTSNAAVKPPSSSSSSNSDPWSATMSALEGLQQQTDKMFWEDLQSERGKIGESMTRLLSKVINNTNAREAVPEKVWEELRQGLSDLQGAAGQAERRKKEKQDELKKKVVEKWEDACNANGKT